jgi:hypothetical protein
MMLKKRMRNLNTVLDFFHGWSLQTLIQIGGQTAYRTILQWCWKICFWCVFCFWCVLLLCRLWWKEFGELVYEIERNLSCSMKLFMSFVDQVSVRWLAGWFRGSEEMRWWGVYLMQAEEMKAGLFGDEEELSC